MSQQLRIFSSRPHIDLTVGMGLGPATPSGGLGGWVTKVLADNISATIWEGMDPQRQEVPIMLEGFTTGDSVEGEVEEIKRLGKPTGIDDGVPPVFKLFGPVHESGADFVLEEIEWGAAIRNAKGVIQRQPLVLHVLEFSDPDNIKIRKLRAKGSKKTGGTSFPGSTYTVKKGDTLISIAADLYGDRSVWKKIAAKNDLRDPNKELPVGKKLKLPADPYG